MLSALLDRTPTPALAYAQCWEDADVLLEALDVQPGHCCLSIASGGDNTLALLARSPQRVVAIDMRGHGESERAAHGYRVSRFAADLADVMATLDLENAVLMGPPWAAR